MKNLRLHQKIQLALLSLSLLPLIMLAIHSVQTLRESETFLLKSATETIDQQVAKNLEMRAGMVARKVADFLDSVTGDLHDLRRIPPELSAYRDFYSSHRRDVWRRNGTNEAPGEERVRLPLYREIAFVAPDGRELIRIDQGEPVSSLRDLSDPLNTTYRTEDYFLRARSLHPGEIYVSRLTGWHVNREEQLGDAPNPRSAIEGREYEGVIRLAEPVYDPDGGLAGVVVLSLDHRHLMEFTQHINPAGTEDVVFPSYESGNYAFMFDDQGWMITHPKYWDIRGLDPDGRLVPPYTEHTSAADIELGRIPYNLNYAGFVHGNYPVVAQAVLNMESGVADVTNVGGSRKIMAYAPIPFSQGVYRESGIFGGVTIGAELSYFHQPAIAASEMIKEEFTRYLGKTWSIILVTGFLVFLTAWWISVSITRPVQQLIAGTKRMASGEQNALVEVHAQDEVGELADSFNRMVTQLGERSGKLMRTLEDLRLSRQEILRERNFKETIVENIDTGILTLTDSQEISSINTPARNLLGLDESWRSGTVAQALQNWPELLEIVEALPGSSTSWGRNIEAVRQGRARTLRVAVYPLRRRRQSGWIMTIEDLTERVNLRRTVERMERLAALGKFSAGIAHEVRNPLTGISLLLDELHDRLLGAPRDQELIQRALAEIERLDELVNGLLEYSSASPKRMRRDRLEPVISDLLFMVRKQCSAAGIDLVEDIDADIPELLFDAGKIKQAVLNLLTNAIEAMTGGGELTLRVLKEKGGVRIEVTDTGIGIPPERLPLIFEPFYTSRGEGTGLGLSITHNIVAEHGGTIEVESRVGEGSCFTILLPEALPPN